MFSVGEGKVIGTGTKKKKSHLAELLRLIGKRYWGWNGKPNESAPATSLPGLQAMAGGILRYDQTGLVDLTQGSPKPQPEGKSKWAHLARDLRLPWG